MNEPVVNIYNLTVDFETIDGMLNALNDVNISIKKGEVVGLVGETGCGKSVTAKMLLGILPSPPSRLRKGEITLFGKNTMAMQKRERDFLKQNVAYIPQDPMSSLNPTFTVGNLMIDLIIWRQSDQHVMRYFRKRHQGKSLNEAREYAEGLLGKVHIPDPEIILNRYPIELSGGMRQRILLAMALIGKPKLMVADEPTTALDVTIQKNIITLIQEKVKEEGLTGLYITHDLGIIRNICHRIYVMYAGTIVECGHTKDILEKPLHPYTKGLIQSIPKLTGDKFIGIRGQIPDYLHIPEGCRFHPRCDISSGECSEEKPAMVQVNYNRFVSCKYFHKAL